MSYLWKMVLLSSLLVFAPSVLPQDSPSPVPNPEDSFSTRQLIVWSSTQKPQPLSVQGATVSQSDAPSGRALVQPMQAANPQSGVQLFSGRVLKNGNEYILEASGHTIYQLKEQVAVGSFGDKNVLIAGTLEGPNQIRVLGIALAS